MRQKALRVVGVLGVLALFAGLVFWAATRNTGSPAFLQLGGQNGYELLFQAARGISRPAADQNTTNLAANVEKNEPSFQTLAAALKLPCETPVELYGGEQITVLYADFKALALALQQKGRFFESKEDWTGAANIYLDVIRFGQAVEHGPLISALVGLAIENIGAKSLNPVLPKLAPAKQMEVCAEIRKLNQSRITVPEVKKRESFFISRSRVNIFVKAYAKYFSLRKTFAKTQGKFATTEKALADLCKITQEPGKSPNPER